MSESFSSWCKYNDYFSKMNKNNRKNNIFVIKASKEPRNFVAEITKLMKKKL